jgi:hypothetical protein
MATKGPSPARSSGQAGRGIIGVVSTAAGGSCPMTERPAGAGHFVRWDIRDTLSSR